MKKQPATNVVVDRCTEAQRKHLLESLNSILRLEAKDFPLNASQKKMRDEVEKLEKKRDELQEHIGRWTSEDYDRKKKIKKDLYKEITVARNAVHFKSQAEALSAVEALMSKYEGVLE